MSDLASTSSYIHLHVGVKKFFIHVHAGVKGFIDHYCQRMCKWKDLTHMTFTTCLSNVYVKFHHH